MSTKVAKFSLYPHNSKHCLASDPICPVSDFILQVSHQLLLEYPILSLLFHSLEPSVASLLLDVSKVGKVCLYPHSVASLLLNVSKGGKVCLYPHTSEQSLVQDPSCPYKSQHLNYFRV